MLHTAILKIIPQKKIYSKLIKGGISFLLFVTICSPFLVASSSKKIKITFINPSAKDDMFWGATTSFMKAAAHDLNIKVDVLYANRNNRFKFEKLVIDLLDSPKKPDFIVLGSLKIGIGTHIFDRAEKEKVPIFLFNTDVPQQDKQKVGRPREKYKYWIGHMFPDDEKAGYDEAISLIKIAKHNLLYSENPEIQLVALSGHRDSVASANRNAGLYRALQEHPEVKLNQLVFANWKPNIASRLSLGLLQRYPRTTIIWTASDGMALGANRGIEKAGKRPGKDILAGGVDWTKDALKSIQAGKLTLSVGGHFMEGGWVLVQLYDYYHGKDFFTADKVHRSQMQIIHSNNVAPYSKKLGSQDWEKIDFKKFTKTHNSKLKAYDFSLKNILSQL